METLTVWGYKNGRAKILFANLAENVSCIARAKRTASEQGYKISRAVRIGTHRNCFTDEDITEKFLTA